MSTPDPQDATIRTDVDLWQKAADTALTEEVKTLRATATSWSASIAALTGLFTLLGVSFTTLITEKIPATAIVEAQRLLIVAFVLMLLASIWGIGASQGLPTSTLANSGAYRNIQREIATTVIHRLAISRLLAAGGMVVLIVAVGLIVQQRIDVLTKAPSGYFQVIQANGPLRCGYGYYDTANVFHLVKNEKFEDGKLVPPITEQLIAVKPIDIKAVGSCITSSIKPSP